MKNSLTLDRFIRLASWNVLTFALDKLAMISIVFFLARILGASDYGRYILAQGLVNTFQLFVVLGAGTILGRYIPVMLEDGYFRVVQFINLLGLLFVCAGGIFTFIGFIGSRNIATFVLNVESSSNIPIMLIVWVLLYSLNSLLLTIFLSLEKGRMMGIASFVSALISVAIVPIMAYVFGLEGAIFASVIVEFLRALVLLIFYRKLLIINNVSIFTPARRADVPLLTKFGIPVFLNSILWSPIMWLAQIIVKNNAPDGLVAVGVFGFSNNILGAVILVSGLTSRAALPIQSSLHARGSHAELSKMTWLISLSQTGLALFIAVPIIIFSSHIMSSIGHDYIPYSSILILMACAGVVVAGQTALGNHLLVNDRPYFIVGSLLPWGAILLSAAAFFPAHGAFALAGGLLIASVVRSGLLYWAWWKIAQTQLAMSKQ
jgi:O-antigen/teichoic acid export membrane protein